MNSNGSTLKNILLPDLPVVQEMTSILRQLFTRNINQLFHSISVNNQWKYTCSAPFSSTLQRFYSDTLTSYEIVDTEAETKLTKEVTQKINNITTINKQGRLFALIHIAGKQRKVTEGDVLIIEGYWPPDVGDKISLDKVLMIGATDFTLVGRPLVQKGLVNIEATVIEKTLSHTKTNFKKKRRKQYMRIHFYRIPQTYLRINKVEIKGELNNPPEVRGLETAIFN